MPTRSLDDLPHQMTEEQYRRLPKEYARAIEVVHGHVIVCESPVPEHSRVTRRLAGALDAAPSTEACIRVETNVDVALWRLPKFTQRHEEGGHDVEICDREADVVEASCM